MDKNKLANIWQNKAIHRRMKIILIEDVLFSYFRTTTKSGLSKEEKNISISSKYCFALNASSKLDRIKNSAFIIEEQDIVKHFAARVTSLGSI